MEKPFRRFLEDPSVVAAVGTFQRRRETSAILQATSFCSQGKFRNPCSSSACNTWLRGSPERSFLGAYSLTWEERGTERLKEDRSWRLGVFPPAQPSCGGMELGWAPQSSVGRVGIRQPRGLCLLGYPRAPKQCVSAARSYSTAAPCSSRRASPAATLTEEPSPWAQSPPPPPPHARARAHTRTRVIAGGLSANLRAFGASGTSHR